MIMQVIDVGDVPEEEMTEGSKATIRWLIDEKLGAKNFAMRYIVIKKGGYTPLHTHDWEHEMFVIKGEGYLTDGKNKIKIKPGNAIFVKPNELHQIINEDSDSLEILCLIPL